LATPVPLFHMEKSKKKIYFEALKCILFLSASLHMIILFMFLFTGGGLGSINYFKLTGIDLLLPSIMAYKYIDIISLIFTAILYLIILKIIKKKSG